jgi:hypothetical protein
MKVILSRKAQNITEVALVIAIVGLVFVGMDMYLRRGMQGKIKDLTDNTLGKGQYGYTSDVSGLSVLKSNADTTADSSVTISGSTGGTRQTVKKDDITMTATSDSEYVP